MEIQLLNNNSVQLINIFFREQRIKRDEENWKEKGASRTGKEDIHDGEFVIVFPLNLPTMK